MCGDAAVVALGGGAIAQPATREVVLQAGTLVYLRGRVECLLARLGDCRDRSKSRGYPSTLLYQS